MTTSNDLQSGLVQTEVLSGGAHNSIQAPHAPETGSASSDQKEALSAVKASLDDGLLRDVLLIKKTIVTGDTTFVNLLGSFDPFREYLNNAYVAQRVQGYQGIKFGMVITVRMTVPGLCTGLYNVQALCDGGPVNPVTSQDWEIDGAAQDSPWSSVQDVHAFLNCEESGAAVLHLPWVYQAEFFKLSDTVGPACWRLLLWALADLNSTVTATATGTIEIFGRMEPGYELVNLQFQGKMEERFGVAKDKVKALQDKKYSATGKKMASMVNSIGETVPFLAPYTSAAAAGMAAVSGLAEMFGFTREADPKEPEPVLRSRFFSNLNNSDARDTGEVVALSVANSVTIDARVGGGEGEDPSAIAALSERWHILTKYTVTSATGMKFATLPVTPFAYAQTLGAMYFMPAAVPGMLFARWRGDMEYMIYVVSSTNYQGSLQVTWEPGDYSNAVYPSDPTNRLTNAIIDLHGSSRTLLRVNYSQQLPALRTGWVGADRPSRAPVDSVNGYLQFHMRAPLTTPKGTGSVVVLILARPRNISYGVPTNTVPWRPDVAEDLYGLNNFYYQGLENNDEESENVVPFVDHESAYPVAPILFGEEVLSCRALMQRFSWYCDIDPYYPALSGGGPTNILAHFPAPPNNYMKPSVNAPLPRTPVTPVGLLSVLFTGVRGSVRYKINNMTTFDSKITARVCVRPIGDWSSALYPAGGAVRLQDPPQTVATFWNMANFTEPQFVYQEAGAEVTIPNYYWLRYWHPRNVISPIQDGTYNVTNNPNARFNAISFFEPDRSGALIRAGFSVFVAGGSDYSVTRFRRVPALFYGPPP